MNSDIKEKYMMACDMNYMMCYLGEMEETAEEVLESKEQIVLLDQKRNKNREALRALSKETEAPSGNKSWICFGNMFIKAKNCNIKHMLEKDQENINAELAKIRKDLKPKVKKVQEMEGKEISKGFDLNPLKKDEITALRSAAVI